VNPLKLIAGGFVAILITFVFLATYFTVEEYEVAVVTSWGKINRIETAGISFKVPYRDDAIFYRTDIQSYTPKDKANIYTDDSQPVDVIYTIQYRIPPEKVQFVYTNAQDYKPKMAEMVNDRLKAEFGKIKAEEVAKKRGEIRDSIRGVLRHDVEAALGVRIVDFQLTNVEFEDTFLAAVRQAAEAKAKVETQEQLKRQAEVQAQTAQVQALGMANAAREQAKGEADARVFVANADATAIKLKGEAEAAAIKAQADALKQNQDLVKLRQAERWDGQLPKQVLSGVVPFMNFEAAK
jgi:regulator of protease activity HflC (stomatin/prohibitin superfamily)